MMTEVRLLVLNCSIFFHNIISFFIRSGIASADILCNLPSEKQYPHIFGIVLHRKRQMVAISNDSRKISCILSLPLKRVANVNKKKERSPLARGSASPITRDKVR